MADGKSSPLDLQSSGPLRANLSVTCCFRAPTGTALDVPMGFGLTTEGPEAGPVTGRQCDSRDVNPLVRFCLKLERTVQSTGPLGDWCFSLTRRKSPKIGPKRPPLFDESLWISPLRASCGTVDNGSPTETLFDTSHLVGTGIHRAPSQSELQR